MNFTNLKELVEDQKSKGRSNISLIKVLDELCHAGLEYEKLSTEKKKELYAGQPAENLPDTDRPIYVMESKAELKALKTALYEKEDRILKREKQLAEREERIINLNFTYLEEREKDNGGVAKVMAMEHEISFLKGQVKDLKAEKTRLEKNADKLLEEIL